MVLRRQYLTVQVQYGNKYPQFPVNLIPSATSTQLYAPTTGDQLSGWTLSEVYVQPFNLSELSLLRAGTESSFLLLGSCTSACRIRFASPKIHMSTPLHLLQRAYPAPPQIPGRSTPRPTMFHTFRDICGRCVCCVCCVCV